MDKLDILRNEIDELDKAIVEFVSRRTQITLDVGREKHARGISTMVSARHQEVIDNYIKARPDSSPMTTQDASELSETVMLISRRAQDALREELK